MRKRFRIVPIIIHRLKEDFCVMVVAKDKKNLLEQNARFEKVLEVWEERGNIIHQLKAKITQKVK